MVDFKLTSKVTFYFGTFMLLLNALEYKATREWRQYVCVYLLPGPNFQPRWPYWKVLLRDDLQQYTNCKQLDIKFIREVYRMYQTWRNNSFSLILILMTVVDVSRYFTERYNDFKSLPRREIFKPILRSWSCYGSYFVEL